MFFVRGDKRLGYRPFERYELPSLKQLSVDVLLRHQEGKVGDRRLPLYRLRWPGEMEDFQRVMVPTIVQRRATALAREETLETVVREGLLLEPTPTAITYHLAVNCRGGPLSEGVGGLSPKGAEHVLEADFALDAKHLAAAQYLKWHAESHRRCSLLRSVVDKRHEQRHTVLDMLYLKSAQLYFYVLGDCIYDHADLWWQRDPHWERMAYYLHLLGRVGRGYCGSIAGVSKGYAADSVSELEAMRGLIPDLFINAEESHWP